MDWKKIFYPVATFLIIVGISAAGNNFMDVQTLKTKVKKNAKTDEILVAGINDIRQLMCIESLKKAVTDQEKEAAGKICFKPIVNSD